MPGFHRRRRSVGGEKLDIERVEPVDWNHTFAVIVQVFHQDLTKTIDLACVGAGGVSREEPRLFLQAFHEIGQFLNNALVAAERFILSEHQAEIKNEFIAIVVWGLDANWIAKHSVAFFANLEKISAKLLPWNNKKRDVWKVDEGVRFRRRSWNDRVFWDLMDDFGTWERISNVSSERVDFESISHLLEYQIYCKR